jgi:hypothetical protein
MSSKVQHHRGVPGGSKIGPLLLGGIAAVEAFSSAYPATFAALAVFCRLYCVYNIEAPAQMPGPLRAWERVPGSAAEVHHYQSSVCFDFDSGTSGRVSNAPGFE